MPEYHGIFDETYTLGWRMEMFVWKIPSEFRLRLDSKGPRDPGVGKEGPL
jgi:hypothetical protein